MADKHNDSGLNIGHCSNEGKDPTAFLQGLRDDRFVLLASQAQHIEALVENAHVQDIGYDDSDRKDLTATLQGLRACISADVVASLALQTQHIEFLVENLRRDIISETRTKIVPVTGRSESSFGSIVATPLLPSEAEDPTLRICPNPTTRTKSNSTVYRQEWQAHTLEFFHSLVADSSYDATKLHVMRCLGVNSSAQNVPESAISRFVHGCFFDWAIGVAILANCISIAYETQVELQKAIKDPLSFQHEFPTSVSVVFAIFFGMELVLRIYSDRLAFIFGPEHGWNFLITVMAICAFVDITVDIDIRYARSIMLFRSARALRMVRLFRLFKGPRDVLCAMSRSVSVLAWSLGVVLVVNLMAGLFFMQALTVHILDSKSVPENTSELWGTIETSMISMFGALTGGIDWLDVEEPLHDTNARYVFLLWAAIMIFGMMSIVIGLFSEKALSASQEDRYLATENQKASMAALLSSIRDLFREMDTEEVGEVTWEQFRDYLQDENVKAFLLSQGLNVLDARSLFKLIDELDDDPNECMDLDSFSLGLMRLTGAAKGSDLFMLLHENRKQTRLLQEFMSRVLPNEKVTVLQ